MAGKRLMDNAAVDANNPLLSTDKFVVANDTDRVMTFAELARILHDGVDGIEAVKFASDEDLAAFTAPENAKYRFKDGEIQFFNADANKWVSLNFVSSSGAVLKWVIGGAEYRTVSVNANGEIAEPSNFIKANKIVTADGGQLAPIKAGSGLIGADYNGATTQEWKLDEVFLKTFIGNTTESQKFIRADSGELVALKCRIKNGVVQFYGEIVNEQ